MARLTSILAAIALFASGCATGSPLHKAAEEGDLAEVNRQLAEGAEVDDDAAGGHTALRVAAMRGDRAIVAALLARGANPNARLPRGATVLHSAAAWRQKEAVEILLSNGANVSATNRRRETPLHLAISSLVTKVPYRPAYVPSGAACPPTCERVVASSSDRDAMTAVAAVLVDGGADPNAATNRGITALHLAAATGHRPLVELLLDHGASVDARSSDGRTPLFVAAAYGQREAAEALLARGAQIDARTRHRQTPLLAAARSGDADLASLLVAHGADVNAKDSGRKTPLGRALWVGALASPAGESLQRTTGIRTAEQAWARTLLGTAPGRWGEVGLDLVQHGAEIAVHGPKEPSPLYLASVLGEESLVAALLDRGAALDEVTVGETALHGAITWRHVDVATLLLSRGANVKMQNASRRTPLHLAAAFLDDAPLAEAILARGADVNARDADFLTPLALARKAGHERVGAVLRAHGGN